MWKLRRVWKLFALACTVVCACAILEHNSEHRYTRAQTCRPLGLGRAQALPAINLTCLHQYSKSDDAFMRVPLTRVSNALLQLIPSIPVCIQ